MVGMDHGCRWLIREAMASQQDALRPLEVLGDRGDGKPVILPDRPADARAYIVERAEVEPIERRKTCEVFLTCDRCDPRCLAAGLIAAEVVTRHRVGLRPRD